MKRSVTIITVLLLLTSSVWAQRKTLFETGFEYDDEPFVIEPGDLNGADDQIGEWSGDTEFPETSGGDILEAPDSVGFADNPYGGRLLLVDRPGADLDGNNFRGSFFADLTDTILLLGAEVSFDVATRRTGGNHNKDYDIVGRSSSGEETFRVRMGTNNNGGERVGYVTDNGDTVIYDLPTVVGEDRPADLDNTGGFPLGENDELATVVLGLGANGFTIDLAHNELNTSPQANAYTTSLLPYNGPGTDLAQLEFVYSANAGTGSNSGFVLDNISVTGFTEIVQGDFNFDGEIDVSDFMVLTGNFGEFTSEGDFDFDGDVDMEDFIGFKGAYQAANPPAGAAAVPEPTTVSLVLFGLLGLLGFRRRR